MADNIVGQAYVELGILDKTKQDITKIKQSIKQSMSGVDYGYSASSDMNKSLEEMSKKLSAIRGLSFTNLIRAFDVVKNATAVAVENIGTIQKLFNTLSKLSIFDWKEDNKEFWKKKFVPVTQFKTMRDAVYSVAKVNKTLWDINNKTLKGTLFGLEEAFMKNGVWVAKFKTELGRAIFETADKFVWMRGQIKGTFKEVKDSLMKSPLVERLKVFKIGIVEIAKSFAPLVSTLAVVTASVVALTIAIKTCLEQAKKIDEIGDAADKIGTSYSSYAKYSKLGEIFAYSASDYESAFKKMRSSQAKGNEAFTTLGISNYQAMSSTQLFDETISKLQSIQDETTRTKLALEIFGKSALNITPLLSASNDEMDRLNNSFKTLGAIVSDTTSKRADVLENDIYMFKQSIEGLKNATTGFIPIIDWVVSKLTLVIGYVTVILEVIFGIKQDTEDMADAMDGYTDSVQDATDAIDELKAGLRGFDELNNLTFNSSSTADTLGLDEDDITNMNDAMSSVSKTMDETLGKIQEFRDFASGFAEEYGAILPYLLLIANAIVGTVLCLTGHPILAIPFFLCAGVGFAGIVSQMSNAEDIDGDGTGWDDYFKSLSKSMQYGIVALNVVVPIVSVLAGVLMLAFGGVATKIAGIGLVCAGIAIAGLSVAGLNDLDEDGVISWSDYIESIQHALENDNWKVIAAFVSILAGVLCLFFAPGVKGKIVGIAMILLGIALPGIDMAVLNTCQDANIGLFGGYILSLANTMSGATASMKGIIDFFTIVSIIGGILLIIFAPSITAKGAGVLLILFGGLCSIANQAEIQGYLQTLSEDPTSFKIEDLSVALASSFSSFCSSIAGSITEFIMLVGGVLLIIFGGPMAKVAGVVCVLSALGMGAIGGIKKSTWEDLMNEGLTKNTAQELVFDLGITTNVTTNITDKANSLTDRMKSWSSNVQMASGGIVNNPGAGVNATVGEAGKEAVLPLENNTEWMNDLVRKINDDSRPTNIILEMDGKKVAQGVVKNMNDLTRSSGKLNLSFV